MRKIYLPLLTLSIIISIASCKKGDTGPAGATGATGPTGPSFTGAISGHVDLYDQYGTAVLTGRNNAQISLNGATAINPDTTGFYLYGGISTGDYSIAATCTGYGATMINRFQFVADTLNRDIKLSAIPSFAMTTFTAYHTAGALYDSLVFTYTADTRARACIVFANNTSSVGSTPSNYLMYWGHTLNANSVRSALLVPAQDLYDAGFTSGSTVYYAAYSYVVNDASGYEDYTTGKVVFNSVSNPITGSATAP
jgi:hypothetical protein